MLSKLRIDRLATLYVFRPLQHIIRTGSQVRIPILMYHSISDDAELGPHPYYRTSTSPSVFVEHMRSLDENKYTVVDLDEAIAILERGSDEGKGRSAKDSRKYAVLTFDDGFRDFYTEAFPLLELYGFTATVFLSTAYIGDAERKLFKDRECLLWDEVRELDKKGITFGSHTINHPILVDLKKEEVENEISQSKEVIENVLGKAVRTFSYPYALPEGNAKFKNQIRSTLERCGYAIGVSTRIGTLTESNHDKYFLSRIPLNSCDDASLFKAKLEGDYDWLRVPQELTKRVKGGLSRLNNVRK
jgi:peptidoglycan/xylan/chitin deacetylase (PgdA/CDA1 family)